MPVIIENHSPRNLPDDAEHSYLLKINAKHITWFRHRRDEGLAECLRRAAEAVERAEGDTNG